MRELALLATLLATAAAPAMSPDARLRAIVAPVSAARLKGTVEKLVSFGTRHTLSSQTDPNRGIGAALNWTESQFMSSGLPTFRPCDSFTGERIPTQTRVCDMIGIQLGTERPNDVVIITAHLDSRVTDIMNANAFEPGANDDGSGVATVLEAARVLSKHKFPGTIVYAALSGEEQGLYGGKVLAHFAKAQGWNVIADLNNDIIGNSCGSDGVCDSAHVRVFSEGPRWQALDQLAGAQRTLGGENDSPSRNISRYLASLAGRLKIGLEVRQVWRTDRFGRGGDHIEFLNQGFPAVRLSVAVENYNWQHQDVRVANGVQYGDTPDHMNFPYLAKITKLNTAALAAIASAPPPPEPRVEGAVNTDTTLTWTVVTGATNYRMYMRRTDAPNWQRASYNGHYLAANLCMIEISKSKNQHAGDGGCVPFKTTLEHIRVDDWVFGVSSVSKNGFEGPVASAVPGGAFKPYVAPPKKP